MLKSIYFSVTNDLLHDQRMIRICSSLQAAGYDVTLIGRRSNSPLSARPYKQIRLTSWFSKGKLMYLEFNFRLFFYLCTRKKIDLLVAIDLDTIIPIYLTSQLRGTARLYDAHEWFSEMKEVISRPRIKRIWKWIEKTFVPRFPLGYTVSLSIAQSFKKLYGVEYAVIMNATVWREKTNQIPPKETFLLYQGAVNEGRCLEWLIPAMKDISMPLWICGEGNFSDTCRSLIREHALHDKVLMLGKKSPEELKTITEQAFAGINLVEPYGQNQIMSLANKFFDYFHAGIPQLTMNFPEYRRINDSFEIALLIDEPKPELIASALNNLIDNKVLYNRLRMNCVKAAEMYNWQEEERKLLALHNLYFKR